jgi:hypothetical protein
MLFKTEKTEAAIKLLFLEPEALIQDTPYAPLIECF